MTSIEKFKALGRQLAAAFQTLKTAIRRLLTAWSAPLMGREDYIAARIHQTARGGRHTTHEEVLTNLDTWIEQHAATTARLHNRP